ncbi:MAG: Signal transduction histidine kinaselike protein [Actinomycetia bacterium]|nr:Signal transduction histidine kinaselike protein [Actinomycetes bacterium]
MASSFAALICIGVGVLVVVAMHSREVGHQRNEVTESTTRVASLIKRGQLPSVLSRGGDQVIQVVDAHGRVITATPKIAGKPPIASFQPTSGEVRADRTLCPPAGLKGCMTVAAFTVDHPGGDWVVYTATPVVPWYVNPTLVIFVSAVALLMIAMMAFGTFRAVGKTLAPVDAIRMQLAEITATDLDQRVPVPKNKDEIKLLAETVNDTLDRLEYAYEKMQRFTSDASHDLRSPITTIRAQLEEALMYPDDTDWPRTANAMLSGVDRLQALVTDLLILARLDACAPLTRAPADLAQLVDTELDRRPHRVKVVKHLREGVFTPCDRLRIARLVTNLLDNAERHADSQIMVTVRPDGSTAVLEVIDDGAGIASGLREMVFERFTRLDASRNLDTGGTGLGLAIARQIAEAHGGSLTIEESPRGACFVLRLAQCSPPQQP